MNGLCAIVFEGHKVSFKAIMDAGPGILIMNAAVAFCLNVAVVFLVSSPINSFCFVIILESNMWV